MTSQASAAQGRGLDPRSEAFVEELAASSCSQRGTLDELAVHRAQRAQRQSGERFDLVLTRLGLVPEADLARLLAEFLGAAARRREGSARRRRCWPIACSSAS